MAQRRQTPKEKFAQIKADHLKKMGGQSSLFPSLIPDNATKKALLALRSELRHLERTLNEREERLESWEEDLRCREADLADVIENEFDEDECFAEHYQHCDCDEEDATDGCGCGNCKVMRGNLLSDKQKERIENALKKLHAPAGDEVAWLEKLFTLKDKRRK